MWIMFKKKEEKKKVYSYMVRYYMSFTRAIIDPLGVFLIFMTYTYDFICDS